MSYSSEYASRLARLSALAKLGFSTQSVAKRPASKTELANLILQKARSDFSVGPGPSISAPEEEEDKSLLDSGKSVALGVLDILARPSYAVAEASNQAFNEGDSVGDVVKGLGQGISGKKQTSFIDVLQKQHKNEITESDEYKRILEQYGQNEADYYKKSEEGLIDEGRLEEVGPGLFTDFVLDPLNLVGVGIAKKPFDAIKAARDLSKPAGELAETAPELAEAATDGVSGALAGTPKPPAEPLPNKPMGNIPEAFLKNEQDPTLSPSKFQDINFASTQPNEIEFPKANRPPFKLPARPDTEVISGVPVDAVKGNDLKSLMATVNTDPKYATLDHVFNKDITPDQYVGLQKARVVNESAQIVDQAGKGNPSAAEFLAPKPIPKLTPVARKETDIAIVKIGQEITNSIADPVKARAAGRQPRYPVFNAPTQNNLSNKLTNAARKVIQSENPSASLKTASPKLVPAVYSRYLDMLKDAEEKLIERGRLAGKDEFYPRGGIKPDTPYLRLSDVLERLPRELAQKAILGPKTADKVLPSVLLRAVTGDKKALALVARDHRELSDAIKQVDWAPVMTKEYALRLIEATNKMEPALKEASERIGDVKGAEISDTHRDLITDETVKKFKADFRHEMPEMRGTFSELLSKMAKPKENVVEQIINNRKSRLAAAVTGGDNAQKAAQSARIAVAEANLAEVLGVPTEAIKRQVSTLDPKGPNDLQWQAAEKSSDGIYSTVLSWVKPDYGYKELRPTVIKNVSVRKASAAIRANQLNKILSMVPTGEHLNFWNEAIGVVPVVPAHAQAVQLLQRAMGNMFGESGLVDKFAGNSSVARSGVTIKDLNRHLRIAGVKDFQFTKEALDPLTGKMVKFDGPQMLQTWRNYVPKSETDLRQFTFGLTQAVENVMVEYSSYVNMAALWGSKAPKSGFVKVSDMHPAIDGLHFPKDIVSQIGKFSRGIDEFYEPLSNNKLVSLYDQALRTWKSGVTIYAPSHHIRNMIGDMFLAWLDGVSNPIYYEKARRVLMANHGHYSDIDPNKSPLKNILGEGRESEIVGEILGQSKKRIPKGSGVIVNPRVAGKRYQVTIDQVYQMGFRHGLFPHSNVIEDMPGSETLMEGLANRFHPGKAGPFQPFGGKVQKAARQLSESREHYARLAHYLHALEHTKASSLEDLFEKSAQRVRKYHPDGLDLTTTEKHVLRRLFPFYAWTRKAIPLVLEGIVTNPAKIMAYPKLMSGMQELQGQDSSVSDPWPEDQLFPDWLTGNAIGPIFDPQSALAKALSRSDDELGYTLVNPGNPAIDVLEDYGNNPIKGVGNSITPFLKIPAEIGFGTEFMSGAPIQDKTEYVDKNIPILSTISRLTSGGVGSGLIEGGDLKGKETEPYNLQALLNYLTGAGIMDTGRYIKGGEFDLKERIRKEAEK